MRWLSQKKVTTGRGTQGETMQRRREVETAVVQLRAQQHWRAPANHQEPEKEGKSLPRRFQRQGDPPTGSWQTLGLQTPDGDWLF